MFSHSCQKSLDIGNVFGNAKRSSVCGAHRITLQTLLKKQSRILSFNSLVFSSISHISDQEFQWEAREYSLFFLTSSGAMWPSECCKTNHILFAICQFLPNSGEKRCQLEISSATTILVAVQVGGQTMDNWPEVRVTAHNHKKES